MRFGYRSTVCLALCLFSSSLLAADSAEVKALFANPPRQYSSAPLWVWNDMLTEQQIIDSMRQLAAQNVKQAFVHPRPGLMTPYLSEDWFRLWRAALNEAERLDMNLWIYDENSYPSGFAGGWVPEQMPESRGRGLAMRAGRTPPKWDASCIAVYRMKDGGFDLVTDAARDGKLTGDGQYLTFFVRRAGNSPWHGNRCYVDLLYPGVTEKFLSVTLDRYAKELGDQFGKRILGSFTDEPELRPAGGLPWTDDLPQQFEKRWGYKLTDHLPSLTRPVGDYQRIRHNYYQTLLDLFIERWGKPYYEWCQKHNIEFTGHYWEHEWPNCTSVPDNMAMSAWQQRPGIDILMNQYAEDTHAQFGNIRSVKELSSLANQLGRSRTICEAYGAGGWDLRFEDMKRIGDWMYALGINTLDQHVSYVTIRGARKADHPQSFSYHEPWWEAYHISATHFARLSAALSSGEQINNILIIEPTTTAWMYNSEANDPKLVELGNSFQKLVVDLEKAQVEFDLGCEDVIARHGSIDGKQLVVGKRKYKTVVLPPNTENLNGKTIELLENFTAAGGTVVSFGKSLTRVDGQVSPRAAQLANKLKLQPEQADAGAILVAPGERLITVNGGTVLHHRRQLADGQLLFLTNVSIDKPASGTIRLSDVGSVDEWDIATGKPRSYPFSVDGDRVNTTYQLPPCGSMLLFFSNDKRPAVAAREQKTTTIAPDAAPIAQRIAPNVLTLDYLDITAAGQTQKNLYFYQANQFAFQKNGMPRNPWDSAVQFRDELIKKTFPATSGFEATYRFTIAGSIPAKLEIVIERPDLYTISCNGKPISATKDAWWLDRAFGRIDITSAAKVGDNEVTIKASPFTIYHELEPAYILGDFTLRPADKGFIIAPAQALKLGKWNEQGCPFYSQGVAYTQTFDLSSPTGRYIVSLPQWYGSVAKVTVNGKPAGYIGWQPWQCDVTDQIKTGRNTVEITVIGTLKNTLGPHHGNPPVGLAWPAMFHQGPKDGPPAGANYSTVGYGLFQPFTLKNLLP